VSIAPRRFDPAVLRKGAAVEGPRHRGRDRNRAGLLGPRRDLHPYFWAGRSGRIVGPSAGTVVPVRLRWRVRSRRCLGIDRRLLNDDRGWRVRVRRIRVRRVGVIGWVVPRIRRAPPKCGPDPDEDPPVASPAPGALASPAPGGALAPAAIAPSVARHRGDDKKRDSQKG